MTENEGSLSANLAERLAAHRRAVAAEQAQEILNLRSGETLERRHKRIADHVRDRSVELANNFREAGIMPNYPQGEGHLPLWVMLVNVHETRTSVPYEDSNLPYLTTTTITGLTLASSGELSKFSQDAEGFLLGRRVNISSRNRATDEDVVPLRTLGEAVDDAQLMHQWDEKLEDFGFRIMTGYTFLPIVTGSISYGR